jgi:hypothetical protein
MIPRHALSIYLGIYAAPIAIPAATARARQLLGIRKARRRLNRGDALTIIGAALGIAVSG